MADKSRLNLSAIQSCLLSGGVDEPVVFHDLIASWPAMKWNPTELTNIFPDQTFKFRLGKQNSEDVQWETKCFYEYATVPNFLEWTKGQCNHDNPLAAYDQGTYWCYADYIHMCSLFGTQPDCPDMLKCVDWSTLGFDGRDGQQSTFWLGSKGAYTVCHHDTYGCNLVAQIHGRKRWVMFPPTDSKYLYPTRVPYEESSVFSLVNIHKPDFKRHPRFKNVTPYVVTLAPGDVLFLPRHWWHLVESLDTTVSINSWIDMEVDTKERLQEAVVRTTLFALMSQEPNLPLDSWLNPTEDLSSHEECMDLLNNSVDALTLVTQDKECVKSGGDDASTLNSPNGKRSIDGDQFTTRKQSRTCAQSQPGHHDTCDQSRTGHHDIDNQSLPHHHNQSQGTLQQCCKHTVIISEEFDRTHVQRLNSCSLSEYLSDSLASLSTHQPRVDKEIETSSQASQHTITMHSETPRKSTVRQDTFIGDKSDFGSCNMATENQGKPVGGKRQLVTTALLVECVTHPDVIALICQKLRDKLDMT